MEDTIDASPIQHRLSMTMTKQPNYHIPFLQSSQTVKRSEGTVNHLSRVDKTRAMFCNRQAPALDLDKLLADQEYKHRQHLTTDQNSQVKHFGLKKSWTVVETEQQSPCKLPKPNELSSRSKKRNYKQGNALSQNAMAVEEHVTQLQRKKTNFYGAPIQRDEEPFSPPDVRVQVAREQLQQVPSSSEILQHSCFCSTSDCLFGLSCTNNLREVPKACIPQNSPMKIVECAFSEDQSLGTPFSVFEECKIIHGGYEGRENLDLLHLKSNSKDGQFCPEE